MRRTGTPTAGCSSYCVTVGPLLAPTMRVSMPNDLSVETSVSPVVRTSAARRSRLPLMVSSRSMVGSTQAISGSSAASPACTACSSGTSPSAGTGAASAVPSNSRVKARIAASACDPSPAAGATVSLNCASAGGAGGGAGAAAGAAGGCGSTYSAGRAIRSSRVPAARPRSGTSGSSSARAVSRSHAARLRRIGPTRASVARTSATHATAINAAMAPAAPSPRARPVPTQRPTAPAASGLADPRRPRTAITAATLPIAARVPARHSGLRHMRDPVKISANTPSQAPTPRASKSPSCTGPATEPVPGSRRMAPTMSPAPIVATPLSSRRRSPVSSGGRGGALRRTPRAPRPRGAELAGRGRRLVLERLGAAVRAIFGGISALRGEARRRTVCRRSEGAIDASSAAPFAPLATGGARAAPEPVRRTRG